MTVGPPAAVAAFSVVIAHVVRKVVLWRLASRRCCTHGAKRVPAAESRALRQAQAPLRAHLGQGSGRFLGQLIRDVGRRLRNGRLAPVYARAAIAVLAGVALGLTWQPIGWWPLLAVSIPAFTLVVRDQRPRHAFALYLFGLAMLTLAVSWVHVLGIWIAAALIVFEALFFGVLGICLSLVGHCARGRWPRPPAGRWSSYARIPFDGFGWTRIAYAAVDTPLSACPLIGVAGVSFAVALVGQLIAWIVLVLWERRAGIGPAGASAGRSSHSSYWPSAGGAAVLPGRADRQRGRQRQRRHRPGQHPGPRHRGPGPGPLGHQQPPVRDRRPDDPGPARPARLRALAGELHRHRPDKGRSHPADGRRRCPGRRHADHGRRGDAGPPEDERQTTALVGAGPRAGRPLRQAQSGALRRMDPLPRSAQAADPDPGEGRRAVGAWLRARGTAGAAERSPARRR